MLKLFATKKCSLREIYASNIECREMGEGEIEDGWCHQKLLSIMCVVDFQLHSDEGWKDVMRWKLNGSKKAA